MAATKKNAKVFGSAETAENKTKEPIEITFYGAEVKAFPNMSGIAYLKFVELVSDNDEEDSNLAKALNYYLENSFSKADLRKISATGADIKQLDELVSYLMEERKTGS